VGSENFDKHILVGRDYIILWDRGINPLLGLLVLVVVVHSGSTSEPAVAEGCMGSPQGL
jgi:flagellin-like protein